MAFSEFELTFMARLSALTVVVEFAGNSYVPPWEVVILHWYQAYVQDHTPWRDITII